MLCPDDLVFRTDSGQCLGADDGTGIWLMWELIKAGVKGLYIFHRAEEVGGQGSGYIAETLKYFNDGHYDKCIAFDRKADKSIITHQACARCCSDEFTEDLAKKMGMGHKADNTGSFTDSASYTDYIAECTNFSVGYYGAHSARETQDIEYLFPFRDALIKVNWEDLVISRVPGEKEYSSTGYYGYGTKKVKPLRELENRLIGMIGMITIGTNKEVVMIGEVKELKVMKRKRVQLLELLLMIYHYKKTGKTLQLRMKMK